jgi:o-succinylbenzoate---CoA ligase
MDSFQININGHKYTAENYLTLADGLSGNMLDMASKIIDFLKQWGNSREFVETMTSGSTGIPKAIQLKKSSMWASAGKTCSFFGLGPNSHALLCLPVNYIAGMMMLVRAMHAQMQLMAAPPVSNPFENLETPIDFTAVTPHMLMASLDSLKDKKVKKLIVGGAQLPYDLEKKLLGLPIAIYETYGMTETCSHIALRHVNAGQTFFQTLDGVGIQHDERQCLVIEAPDIHDAPIVTNDIVELMGNNQFRWLGRFDHVINSGGIKIFPEAVEKAIAPLMQCNYYIAPMPDEHLGNRVALVVESPRWGKKRRGAIAGENEGATAPASCTQKCGLP